MAIETNAATAVPRRRSVSMADVARRANVSGQTVSRVSNGKQNVDTETRERVLEAMRALGYRPNSAARALRTGRFHSIGVIMFTLASFGNMRTLEAIADAAGAADFTITLLPMASRTEEGVRSAFSRLHEQAEGFQIFNPGSPTDRRRQPRHTMGVAEAAGGKVTFSHLALD